MTMRTYLKRKAEMAQSLDRLIATNNGRYQSAEQRRFLEQNSRAHNLNRDSLRATLPCGGRINLGLGQSLHVLPFDEELVIDGVSYSMDHAYICDAEGVVRKVKVLVNWNTDECTIETLWERQ